jgi:hypothetical protein
MPYISTRSMAYSRGLPNPGYGTHAYGAGGSFNTGLPIGGRAGSAYRGVVRSFNFGGFFGGNTYFSNPRQRAIQRNRQIQASKPRPGPANLNAARLRLTLAVARNYRDLRNLGAYGKYTQKTLWALDNASRFPGTSVNRYTPSLPLSAAASKHGATGRWGGGATGSWGRP